MISWSFGGGSSMGCRGRELDGDEGQNGETNY